MANQDFVLVNNKRNNEKTSVNNINKPSSNQNEKQPVRTKIVATTIPPAPKKRLAPTAQAPPVHNKTSVNRQTSNEINITANTNTPQTHLI